MRAKRLISTDIIKHSSISSHVIRCFRKFQLLNFKFGKSPSLTSTTIAKK